MTTVTPPNETLRGLAAVGLPGAMRELPPGPLDENGWRALRTAAVSHGLQGHLAHAVAEERLATTSRQREDAGDLHVRTMAVCLELEKMLLETVGQLGDAGVEVRVLKGPAVAHTAYAEPALRVFRDVDVVVDDADRAGDLLRRAGLRRMDRRGHDGVSTFGTAEGLTLDIHTHIAPPGSRRRIPREGLLSDKDFFVLSGREVPKPPSEVQLIHACLDVAVASSPRWTALRDLAALSLLDDLSAQKVVGLAHRWSVPSLVAGAVGRAWEEFALADRVPLSEWACRVSTDGEREPLAGDQTIVGSIRRAFDRPRSLFASSSGQQEAKL